MIKTTRSRLEIRQEPDRTASVAGALLMAAGGNRSWDLEEFAAVVLVSRERRRRLKGFTRRTEIVCLRRPDGTDLELYWSGAGGDEIASRVSGFTGLPYLGRGAG